MTSIAPGNAASFKGCFTNVKNSLYLPHPGRISYHGNRNDFPHPKKHTYFPLPPSSSLRRGWINLLNSLSKTNKKTLPKFTSSNPEKRCLEDKPFPNWEGTPWKINMEHTNHPFRKENDLRLCSMLIFQGVLFQGLHPWPRSRPLVLQVH